MSRLTSARMVEDHAHHHHLRGLRQSHVEHVKCLSALIGSLVSSYHNRLRTFTACRGHRRRGGSGDNEEGRQVLGQYGGIGDEQDDAEHVLTCSRMPINLVK
jgi:hypothetical protein